MFCGQMITTLQVQAVALEIDSGVQFQVSGRPDVATVTNKICYEYVAHTKCQMEENSELKNKDEMGLNYA